MSPATMLKRAYEEGLIDLDVFERFTDHMVNGRTFLLPDHVTDRFGTPDRELFALRREQEERARRRRWIAARSNRRRVP